MNKYLALVALCVTAVAVWPWYHRRRLCESDILNSIIPGRFRDLKQFLKGNEDSMPCEEFWARSHGISGVIARLRDMTVIVRLLQYHVRAGRISHADARYVWCKATEQVWFSLMAVPEAIVCCLWRKLPHACGLFALRCHYEVTLRAFTVCSTEDASQQLSRLL